MQDGVFFFLFFYRAPFVFEDVHRAGGACHQGTIPCPLWQMYVGQYPIPLLILHAYLYNAECILKQFHRNPGVVDGRPATEEEFSKQGCWVPPWNPL